MQNHIENICGFILGDVPIQEKVWVGERKNKKSSRTSANKKKPFFRDFQDRNSLMFPSFFHRYKMKKQTRQKGTQVGKKQQQQKSTSQKNEDKKKKLKKNTR